MLSEYATTSNVHCNENMTSRVGHSERGSVISDCLVDSVNVLSMILR